MMSHKTNAADLAHDAPMLPKHDLINLGMATAAALENESTTAAAKVQFLDDLYQGMLERTYRAATDPE